MTENIRAFAARFIEQISDRLYDPNPRIDGYDRAEMIDALTGEFAAGISAWLRDTLPFVDELLPIEAWLVSVSAPDEEDDGARRVYYDDESGLWGILDADGEIEYEATFDTRAEAAQIAAAHDAGADTYEDALAMIERGDL